MNIMKIKQKKSFYKNYMMYFIKKITVKKFFP